MLTLKRRDLRPPSKSPVNFDHHPHKNKVHRSSHSKQINFGPRTVNFDPPHKKRVTFDPNAKPSQIRSLEKNKLISTPLLKSSQFDPHPKIKSISLPHKSQVNFDPHTKTKYFESPRKNHVNSEP